MKTQTIERKAKNAGFDSIKKLDEKFVDEHKKEWEVYLAYNSSDDENEALGLPCFLLKQGKTIREATYSETMALL